MAKPKKKKPSLPWNIIRHGERDLKLPVLSAPVGPETAALSAKYPKMNQPQDVQLVDYYLSALEAMKDLGPTTTPNEMGYARLLGVVNASTSWSDRSASIRALQAQLGGISDSEERELGLVKPNGQTLKALVDMGDLAELLLSQSGGAEKFIHTGTFDRQAIAEGFAREFKGKRPSHDFIQLLGYMERDGYVFDIRWMAYMLGTVAIETGETYRPITEKGLGDLGRVKKPKNAGAKTWHNLPVGTERKLDYWRPVKVHRLPDGRAQVTEWDGDGFIVSADGKSIKSVSGSGIRGAVAVDKVTNTLIGATAAYTTAPGPPLHYHGRGYCQITWWDNYVAAGQVLGRNLDFLFAPELVLSAAIAYQIMSTGIRTGKIFAHGLSIGRFICGGRCDYKSARQMVNADGGPRVEDYALRFERILLAAKANTMVA